MELKRPVIKGHPVHAILSDLPAALIPTALLAAAAERAKPGRETRYAARCTARARSRPASPRSRRSGGSQARAAVDEHERTELLLP